MGFYTTPSGTKTTVLEAGLFNNTPVDIEVEYRNAADAYDALSSGYSADTLKLALNDGFEQQIAAGSVRFTMGNSSYIDRNGTLYRDIDPKTGSGTAAGQIFYGTGGLAVAITSNIGADTSATKNMIIPLSASSYTACKSYGAVNGLGCGPSR